MSTILFQSFRWSIFLLSLTAAFLSGCKKDSSATGPSDGVITVSGRVVNTGLQPVANVPVQVTGKASVNTDANGAFTFTGVNSPYDVTVINGSTKTGYIYRRLTRGNPTLVFISDFVPLPYTANVGGSIYPTTAFPQPAGRVTSVALASTAGIVFTTANGAVSPATYSFPNLGWAGSTTVSATIFALQWDYNASGLPTTYLRYGTRAGISITAGVTLTNVNDTMTTVPATVTFGGSVSVPSGYTIATKEVTEQMSGVSIMLLLVDGASSTTFSYKTPDLAGGGVGLAVLATKGAAQTVAYASGLAANNSAVSLSLPAAPELSLPIDATTAVKAGAQFSWNGFPNGMHVLYFDGPAGHPDYYIMTTAANDSLPNLTTAGLPLPASSSYQWTVLAFAPFANMDVATGALGFIPAGWPSLLMAGTGSWGNSATRSFTTAP